MRHHIFLVPLAAAFTTLAAQTAQSPSTLKGEIIEFGTYHGIGDKTVTNNANSPTGITTNWKQVEFIDHTDKIPLRKDTWFGYRYKLTGFANDDQVTLRKHVTHPPFKNHKGEMETEYTLTSKHKPMNGNLTLTSGYGLGGNALTAPGKWTFEIWVEDQKLVSKSFTTFIENAPNKP